MIPKSFPAILMFLQVPSTSNLYRYAEISKACNKRFLDAMVDIVCKVYAGRDREGLFQEKDKWKNNYRF